ncbi:hypothetical protein CP532_6202 [Ophiocordyceps camponoti-leonardi (nom. inval.)]|nr:hypothetical protein CP532_6202 [Ophiocordyceps camponoti-leonardi (nom. inval.)]
MISRVFLSSSVCLQCRLGLSLRRGARPTDNILLNRASRPLRFASGSAALTKESFEARFTAAAGSGKSRQERKSDVRSQESIEALLSGAEDFETTRRQPEKQKTRNSAKPKPRARDNEPKHRVKDEEPKYRAKGNEPKHRTKDKELKYRVKDKETKHRAKEQETKYRAKGNELKYRAKDNEPPEAWIKSSKRVPPPPRVNTTESEKFTSEKHSGIRSQKSIEAIPSGAADSKTTTQPSREQETSSVAKPVEGAYNDELYKEYINNLKASLSPPVPDQAIDPLTGRMLILPMQPQPFEVRKFEKQQRDVRHVAKIHAIWEESKNVLPSPEVTNNASLIENASRLTDNVAQEFKFDLPEDEKARKEDEEELPQRWMNAAKADEGRDTCSTDDLSSSPDSAQESQGVDGEARKADVQGPTVTVKASKADDEPPRMRNEAQRENDKDMLKAWIDYSKQVTSSTEAATEGLDISPGNSNSRPKEAEAFRFQLSDDGKTPRKADAARPETWIGSKQVISSPDASIESLDALIGDPPPPPKDAQGVDKGTLPEAWISRAKGVAASPKAAGSESLDKDALPQAWIRPSKEVTTAPEATGSKSVGNETRAEARNISSKEVTTLPEAAGSISVGNETLSEERNHPSQEVTTLSEAAESESVDTKTLPETSNHPSREVTTSPEAAESGLATGDGKPPSISPSPAQQLESLDATRDEAPDAPREEVGESRAEPEHLARPDIPPVQAEGASQSDKNNKPRPRPYQPRRGTFFHHENLGLVTLGEPATALLTTDPDVSQGRRRPEPRLTLIEEADTIGLPMHCHNVYEQEQEQESEEEAMERLRRTIDDLRPKDTTALREREVTRLAKKLTEGFTSQQLMAYYKDDEAHGLQMHSSLPSYPWIVQHQPWQAMRSMTLSQLRPKMRHAIRIITETWKLDVEEQVEGQGIMTVKLKPDVFKLIAQPSSPLLQGLSDIYFDTSNHERLSHSPDTYQLSIHSRRSTALTILACMDEMLESKTTKRVTVKDVDEDNLTEAALDELGRITNTLLKYHSKDSELSISWIPEDMGTTTTAEGKADIILRLLSTWQPPASVNKVQILTSTGESDGKELTFVTHHRDLRALSWRDKLREWSRCVSPISISSGDGDAVKKSVTAAAATATPLSKHVSFPKTKVKVDDKTTYHLSATFGHILHLRPHVRTAKLASNHRVMSPLVPHPASLTTLKPEGADDEVIVDRSTTMILHFVPDPTAIGDEGRQLPPRIRLRIPVKDDADFSISSFSAKDSSLEAVIPSIAHDVLLPAESVDVRLSQEQTIPLASSDKSIQDFLAKSNLNLLQGRVKTPSRITLSIPTRLLLLAPTADKSKEKKKKKRGRKAKSDPSSSLSTNETIEIPFLFNGLELHQTIETAHKTRPDLRIRYSSIEAGHQGGRRQELSLHAPPSRYLPLEKDEVASFLDAVNGIAVGDLFSWHDGHRLMQRKTGERFKEHMLDQPLDYEHVAGYHSRRGSADPPSFSSSSSPSFPSSPSPSFSPPPLPNRSPRPPRIYTPNQQTTPPAPPS